MLILIIFGVGMMGLGGFMIVNPIGFSDGIITFSEKSWFHVFEIASRFIVGILFIVFANNTSYPTLVSILGVILCFVGVFITIIGANRHRRFAALTAKIGKGFRMLGILGVMLGASLVYIAVA